MGQFSLPRGCTTDADTAKINELHLALKLLLVVMFSNGCNHDLQKKSQNNNYHFITKYD